MASCRAAGLRSANSPRRGTSPPSRRRSRVLSQRRETERPTAPDLDDGFQSLAVIIAAEESARNRRARGVAVVTTVKILLVNDYAVPQGGAEILILNLREAFRAQGHDARLFTSTRARNGQELAADYTCLRDDLAFSHAPSIGESMGGHGIAARPGEFSAGRRPRKDVPDPAFAFDPAAAPKHSHSLPRRLVSPDLSAGHKAAPRRDLLL